MKQKIKTENLINQKFNNLTVIEEYLESEKSTNNRKFKCLCNCGNYVIVTMSNLRTNHTKSCGCLYKLIFKNKIHGKTKTPEFNTWVNIKQRCYNPNKNFFHRYGGRGIIVCDRWLNSFENFYEDMGNKPGKNWSLERINNDGNYELSNCKWATQKEQCNNTKNNVFYTFNNETLTLTQLSDKYKINYKTLHKRLKDGWNIEKALTTPIQIHKKLVSKAKSVCCYEEEDLEFNAEKELKKYEKL